MKYLQPITLLFVVLFFLLLACNKPSPFGGEFVEDSKLNIKLLETIPMMTSTVVDDSVLVYSPSRVSSVYFCGDYVDPVFGKTTANIYTMFGREKNAKFLGNTIDSVVLQLPYDAERSYGKTDETFGFEVYRVAEVMDWEEKYYSHQEFAISDKVGEISLVPVINDSVTINAPLDTVKLPAQMRIDITDLFADYNDLDTNIFLDDSLFYAHFNGVKIVPVTENSGMLSFNLIDENAGVKVYYHAETAAKEAFYPVKRLRMSTFEHDYSGSVVDGYLNTAGGDSLIFVQGMSGVDGIIEIQADDSLKNKVINKAELIFSVYDMPGDDPILYPETKRLFLSYVTDTSYYVIKDVLIASKANNIEFYFGGIASETEPVTYTMNITNYFHEMLDGDVSNKLALTIYSSILGYAKAGAASRVVLGGTGNTTNAVKLRVTYTDY